MTDIDDDTVFLREVESGAARFKVSTKAVAADLGKAFGRIRQPVREWPWPARLDHVLGTRPIFEILVEGPRGDIRGWLKSLRQLTGNLLTPRGRAWLRWHWDHVHNDDRRADLLRKLNAHTRLERMQSRYWLQGWFLADQTDEQS